ncbi:type II toxin-antitoxin system PemK/MazF family toxin [Streptomyces sp. NPDC006552]|uniref:type II toxin-antitoxin system PemK/MazF family toxin n=1 Tax=Streptomyces sp. NPDC006552 TaxID=3157179 RepID=UPI0033A3ABD1
MDTSWWLALAAVVLLALIAALVDGWGRGSRRRRLRSGSPTAAGGPRPGEIWWALVPYEDGPGGKDRPCLVLNRRGDTVQVVKITSRHHEERPGVIALPPGAVGDARERRSYLETDELRDVPLRDFRRRAGVIDPALWRRVRHLG